MHIPRGEERPRWRTKVLLGSGVGPLKEEKSTWKSGNTEPHLKIPGKNKAKQIIIPRKYVTLEIPILQCQIDNSFGSWGVYPTHVPTRSSYCLFLEGGWGREESYSSLEPKYTHFAWETYCTASDTVWAGFCWTRRCQQHHGNRLGPEREQMMSNAL